MSTRFFNRLSWYTLITIFLVILAGGVVRMTGSGMGCPDWPKCFDCYIPPTSVDQLPENYKEIYSEKRKKQIKRFVGFLKSLGFDEEAEEILHDKSLLIEQDFNALNTWTEYINRLMGALAGLFIFIQAVLVSLNYKKQRMIAIVLSWILVFITGFQAWFGAMVVATNIVPWVLSVHMLLALLMIIIQLHIMKAQKSSSITIKSKPVFFLSLVGSLLMVIQTIVGSRVRQEIDGVKHDLDRAEWMDQLSSIFTNHQILALVITFLAIALIVHNIRSGLLSKWIYILCGLILFEGIVGMSFGLTNMSPILQPLHLLSSMLIFTWVYQIFIHSSTNEIS